MSERWTKEELSTLKDNVDVTLEKLTSLIPSKTQEQIIDKMNRVYRNTTLDVWTEEELEIIVENNNSTIFNLMKLLPKRSYSAIQHKRYVIHGPKGSKVEWTPTELTHLSKLKGEGYTNFEIAQIMGRPLNSVYGKLYVKSNIKRRNGRGHKWTTEENEYVKENVLRGISVEHISGHLNMSINNVLNKARHLGVPAYKIMTEQKLYTEGRFISLKAEAEETIKISKRLIKEADMKYKEIKRLEESLNKKLLKARKKLEKAGILLV